MIGRITSLSRIPTCAAFSPSKTWQSSQGGSGSQSIEDGRRFAPSGGWRASSPSGDASAAAEGEPCGPGDPWGAVAAQLRKSNHGTASATALTGLLQDGQRVDLSRAIEVVVEGRPLAGRGLACLARIVGAGRAGEGRRCQAQLCEQRVG